jgi:hypothetical protein
MSISSNYDEIGNQNTEHHTSQEPGATEQRGHRTE